VYESFFGLRGKPFQLTPDPSFFYDSRGHKRAMSYLKYGLLQGEGFIVVTGEVGAGKTTLIRSLLRTLTNERVVAAQLVSTQVDADDVLRLVCAAYRLPHEGHSKAALLQNLERFFNALAREGKRAILFVDEAQNLTARAVEELRMLSNFQVGERWMMQTFLLGQPEFRAILQSPELQQLRQRVIAQYHLGPLDDLETKAYIEHRLQHVGWRDNPRFEPDAFALIHEYSGGIPRRINTLCDRLLLAAYLEERHVLARAHVEEVIRELHSELGPDHDVAAEPAVPGLDALSAPGGGAAYARAHAADGPAPGTAGTAAPASMPASPPSPFAPAAPAAQATPQTSATPAPVRPLHAVPTPPSGPSVAHAPTAGAPAGSDAATLAQLERSLLQALEQVRTLMRDEPGKTGTLGAKRDP
jgi:putative secretion ATPase (PEP-CTERM system associated)